MPVLAVSGTYFDILKIPQGPHIASNREVGLDTALPYEFDSWPHAVTAIGCAQAAQQTVLPACLPLTADEEERKRRRQAIALLKRLLTGERWDPLVTTVTGFGEAVQLEPGTLSAGSVPILTEGSVHEARTVRTLPKQPGTTYLFDRGFWSFTDFDGYCRDGIYFVTRCKENAQIAHLTSYPVPADSDVIADEEVVLGRGTKRMEHSVRLVTVLGEDGAPVQFVTNRFDLPAQLVGQLYQHRWQIELFFRWLKHHFRTLRFFGHTRQAVFAQIAAAFLAHILLVYRYRQLQYRGGLRIRPSCGGWFVRTCPPRMGAHRGIGHTAPYHQLAWQGRVFRVLQTRAVGLPTSCWAMARSI